MSEIIIAKEQVSEDSLMQKLLREKEAAREFQKRKHEDWNDNYELYRNKVRTNRLTQRQAVNIPLMKETIKTAHSKIDDPPNVDWREKSSDELKELIYQEIWNDQFRTEKFEWIDALDKKNVLLNGLSVKFLNPTEKGVEIGVLDVFDVVFDPLMNPLDIETARFIVRQNIFRSLREILADKRYSEKGKQALKTFLSTKEGVIQTTENKEEYMKKQERLKAMGVMDSDFALFGAGDVVVNLTEHYTLIWNKNKFERRVVVYADDSIELLNEPLKDLIGMDKWPFVVWFEDPEINDIYPDSIADLVRTPNKVLNVWYSQLIENRTLRNFQMYWYDATVEGYVPQTYEPGPGKALPAPGNPKDVIMPVDIQGLDETLTAIEYITKVVERGSGTIAIDKGVAEKGVQTLGEVEILVGKAMERSVAMAKFYRDSWAELARKWDALMQANPPQKLTLYKTGRSGKLYSKTFYPSDWRTEAGYEPIVSSTSEQEVEQTKGIQKWMFVRSQFPNNRVLDRIARKRMLELLDVTPDELKEIEEEAEQVIQQPSQEQTPPTPQETQQLAQQIENQVAQLNA